jgi:hypothetical protein
MEALVNCVECNSDFDVFETVGHYVSDKNYGGFVIAFCPKCWKVEKSRRGVR